MKSFFTPCFYTRSAQGEDKEHEKVTSISVAVEKCNEKSWVKFPSSPLCP